MEHTPIEPTEKNKEFQKDLKNLFEKHSVKAGVSIFLCDNDETLIAIFGDEPTVKVITINLLEAIEEIMVVKPNPEEDLKTLKTSYKEAIANDKEAFIFRGQHVITRYAKYLIEFLESKTKIKQKLNKNNYDK